MAGVLYDLRLFFLQGAEVLGVVVLFAAERLALLAQLCDSPAKAGDIADFKHSEHCVKVILFVSELRLRIEERKIPRLVRVNLGAKQIFCRRMLVHFSPSPKQRCYQYNIFLLNMQSLQGYS